MFNLNSNEDDDLQVLSNTILNNCEQSFAIRTVNQRVHVFMLIRSFAPVHRITIRCIVYFTAK